MELDHVYLVPMTEQRDQDYGFVAEQLMVAHAPGVSAIVRWQLLD